MSILSIANKLPSYAADTKTNVQSLFSDVIEGLTETQVYGVSLTIGYMIGDEQMLNIIRSEAKFYLEELDAQACKAASIIMMMTNTYYKFTYALKDPEIMEMAIDLETTVISDPGVDKTDFELYALAASIINACPPCIKAHTNNLLKKGVSKAAIRNVARIAAVLQACSKALRIERIRSYDFEARQSGL
jgi:alkyl hydroperoxide reductase subunit D